MRIRNVASSSYLPCSPTAQWPRWRLSNNTMRTCFSLSSVMRILRMCFTTPSIMRSTQKRYPFALCSVRCDGPLIRLVECNPRIICVTIRFPALSPPIMQYTQQHWRKTVLADHCSGKHTISICTVQLHRSRLPIDCSDVCAADSLPCFPAACEADASAFFSPQLFVVIACLLAFCFYGRG